MSKKKRSHFWRDPFEWILSACLMLLFAAIALQIAVSVLAHIWAWLVLIAAIVGGIFVAIRFHLNRRRSW